MNVITMSQKSEKGLNGIKLLFWLLAIFSIMLSIFIWMDSQKPTYYGVLPFLPLSFCILSYAILCIYDDFKQKITFWILYLGYFFRFSIVPFIMFLGDYQAKATNYDIYNNMNQAIFIMIYDMCCIWFTFYMFNLIRKKNQKEKNTQEEYFFEINYRWAWILIFIILGVAIVCFVKQPLLIHMFSFFLTTSSESLQQTDELIRMMEQLVPNSYYSISKLCVDTLRFILPIIFILKINQFKGFSSNIKFLLSLMIILLFGLVITLDRAFTVFSIISLLFILYYLHPKKKKSLNLILILGLFVFVVGGLLVVTGVFNEPNENVWIGISKTVQAYFTGPVNFAAAINLGYGHFSSIIPDIGKSITGVAVFFKEHVNIKALFNAEYYYNSSLSGHIIPSAGHGYYYFGTLLSPVLSCFIVYLAINLEVRMQQSFNLLSKYVYIVGVLISSLSLIIYNFVIFINLITSLFIPLLIFSYISTNLAAKSIRKKSIGMKDE
ncbi:O-antigen polymerase [Bacillus sp. KNSH11]|uniref:O-antigen polymerase n=1 Tax=Bacillus sp. KNSH11 TaxID=3461368 RepID=UPI0008FDA920|nr:O-antigen polymerase [Bacillus cereus]OJD94628.1 hypothetical protein A9485_05160 [Bacillus cereus]